MSTASRGERTAVFLSRIINYYLCDTLPEQLNQQLDDYEAEERFTLEYVDPRQAIGVNRSPDHGPKDQQMLEREARVLECLMAEGLL